MLLIQPYGSFLSVGRSVFCPGRRHRWVSSPGRSGREGDRSRSSDQTYRVMRSSAGCPRQEGAKLERQDELDVLASGVRLMRPSVSKVPLEGLSWLMLEVPMYEPLQHSHRCFSNIGSSSRAGYRLAELRPTTATVHVTLQETSLCRFDFAWSRSLRIAEKVATSTQVPLARPHVQTVRAERCSQSLGQPTRYGQAGRPTQGW
jgi:hypothetical protein